MEMNMYDALGYLNNRLEFEHNQLFNYILWTSSGKDNILRTKTITRQKPIKDKIIDCKWIMLATQSPVDELSFDFRLNKTPPTKLQVYFPKSAKEVQQYKEMNEKTGYLYVYTYLTDWSNYKENEVLKKLHN